MKHKHKAYKRTQKREIFSYPRSDLPEPIESNAKFRKVWEFGCKQEGYLHSQPLFHPNQSNLSSTYFEKETIISVDNEKIVTEIHKYKSKKLYTLFFFCWVRIQGMVVVNLRGGREIDDEINGFNEGQPP